MLENYTSEREICVQLHITLDLHILFQDHLRSSVKGRMEKEIMDATYKINIDLY